MAQQRPTLFQRAMAPIRGLTSGIVGAHRNVATGRIVSPLHGRVVSPTTSRVVPNNDSGEVLSGRIVSSDDTDGGILRGEIVSHDDGVLAGNVRSPVVRNAPASPSDFDFERELAKAEEAERARLEAALPSPVKPDKMTQRHAEFLERDRVLRELASLPDVPKHVALLPRSTILPVLPSLQKMVNNYIPNESKKITYDKMIALSDYDLDKLYTYYLFLKDPHHHRGKFSLASEISQFVHNAKSRQRALKRAGGTKHKKRRQRTRSNRKRRTRRR